MTRSRHRLLVSPELALILRSLHPHLKHRVRASLVYLLADPRAGKPLTLDLAELLSYRMGRRRLIYRVIPGRTLELISFGPRESIYEETSRLVAREAGAKRRDR